MSRAQEAIGGILRRAKMEYKAKGRLDTPEARKLELAKNAFGVAFFLLSIPEYEND